MTLQQELRLKTKLDLAYQNYAKELKAHALFKISDPSTGEDLVQNTFMRTWKYIVNGGDIQKMKAFLYHVLNNAIVDEYRKQKTVSLDLLTEKGFEPSIDESNRSINILDGKVVASLVPRLPIKYRKIIHMRYIRELNINEIAKATGQSKNTVSVQVHRGIELLKSIYYGRQMA